MIVLDTILENLRNGGSRTALIEVVEDTLRPVTSRDLLDRVQRIRGWLKSLQIERGDRVALLANNSATWAAADLAILLEGAICVPLYARQNPTELAGMLNDCTPSALHGGLPLGTLSLSDATDAAMDARLSNESTACMPPPKSLALRSSGRPSPTASGIAPVPEASPVSALNFHTATVPQPPAARLTMCTRSTT